MNFSEPFLQAILASPEADEPRLRYAAWLDDRCDPLGEFMRVQCWLARMPLGDPRWRELERRQRELLADHEPLWTEKLAPFLDFWVLRRGLIEEVALTAESFLAHADTLFELAPIQEVHLSQVNGNLSALVRSPYLGRAGFLDLSSNSLRDGGVRLLIRARQLAQLHGINLGSTGLGDGGAHALAAAPHLGRLQELYLTSNHISDAGGKVLAAAPHFGGLTALHLDFNALGHDGAQALVRRFGQRVHV